MRGFVIHAVKFLAFALLAYPVLLLGLVRMLPEDWLRNARLRLASNGHLLTRMREHERMDEVDLVFLGSSHAYRGFDTRIWQQFGYQSFNLGSSAQSPLQTEVMVKSSLRRLSPKLVILEVHPAILRSNGYESAIDLASNHRLNAHILLMAARMADARIINSIIRSAGLQVTGAFGRIAEPPETTKDRYVAGGYVERISQERKLMPELEQEPEAGFRDEQVRAFRRCTSFLRETKIPFVLVEAPVTKGLLARWQPVRGEFDRIVRSEGPYINMNGIRGLSDDLHFFSPGHLNQAGVERFNAALFDSLMAHGFLNASTKAH